MRWTTLLTFTLLLIGCRGQFSDKPPIHPNPNMMDQEKFDPQEANAFFADRRANRPPVDGAVPREALRQDSVLFQGRTADGQFVADNPLPVTRELLLRGRERFMIYCSPCHDRTGSGRGMVIQYPLNRNVPGFPPIPSYHEDRIRNMADGQIFDAITHGVRTMPSYAMQVAPRDRWAIVAYIRALQRSQTASRADVPRDILDTLEHRP